MPAPYGPYFPTLRDMAKLRLGMIGTGVAARRLYLPALQRLGKKIEVVACTNRTRRKAEDYARLAGILNRLRGTLAHKR